MLALKLKSRWKEIWNHVETNSIQCFPEFDGLRQPPSSFEDVFRHFVMNLSDFFWIHSHFSVYGRVHQSFPTGLVPNKSLNLASTFSASPHRGLRHSSQCQTARSKYITNLILRRGASSSPLFCKSQRHQSLILFAHTQSNRVKILQNPRMYSYQFLSGSKDDI